MGGYLWVQDQLDPYYKFQESRNFRRQKEKKKKNEREKESVVTENF